jgi:hypothetical protein
LKIHLRPRDRTNTVDIHRLESAVEKIVERSGGRETMGSRPIGDVEGAGRVSAGRGGVQGVVGTKNVLDDAATRLIIHLCAGFCLDDESLVADGAANV